VSGSCLKDRTGEAPNITLQKEWLKAHMYTAPVSPRGGPQVMTDNVVRNWYSKDE
jgi:hypothetical protein